MASYKIIQDIEAEDKILGSLTLKQFVFAFIAVAFLGVGWWVGGKTSLWMVVVFFIPAIPFIFLAAPIGKDQPNDVWLGAQLRFWFKPRIRKWSQSGLSKFITITAPKKEEHIYTDGLSREEVKSRLQTLANSLDYSGRLRGGISLPSDTQAGSNEAAGLQSTESSFNQAGRRLEKHFQSLIDNQASANREVAMIKMQTLASSTPSLAGNSITEAEFLDNIHKRDEQLIAKPTPPVAVIEVEPAQPPVIAEDKQRLDPAIIKQFSGADDLKVSTIATMADQVQSGRLLHSDEVIQLH